MNERANQKAASRHNILEAAGRRLRAEGMQGATIAAIMADAGLTHGAFYAHFDDKDDLLRAALVHALAHNRQKWAAGLRSETWAERLPNLAKRYLTAAHRDQPADGCALAALSSEAARGEAAFKQTYEQELLKTLTAVCRREFDETDDAYADDALALVALMVGALTLSRAVVSADLSDRILAAGITAADKLATYED